MTDRLPSHLAPLQHDYWHLGPQSIGSVALPGPVLILHLSGVRQRFVSASGSL